ncbi:MAG: hypothetical protein V7L14_00965 [Nostoc sp.]|uniref:hypothetical protein n=1 Tax=Nostoc sp. TaxID=1180 RepID=UPI002FF4BBB9
MGWQYGRRRRFKTHTKRAIANSVSKAIAFDVCNQTGDRSPLYLIFHTSNSKGLPRNKLSKET